MKRIGYISIIVGMLSSCNKSRTIFISNKTDNPITLLVDSTYNTTRPAFKDSLNGLKIEKKRIFNFGKGKWSKEDKASLEKMLKHTRIMKEGSSAIARMPNKTKVSHISFDVEELWIEIK